MKITPDEVRKLPDGSKVQLFLSGDGWDEEYGKVLDAIKIKDKLFVIEGFYDIEDLEIEEEDELGRYYTIETAYNKKCQYF